MSDSSTISFLKLKQTLKNAVKEALDESSQIIAFFAAAIAKGSLKKSIEWRSSSENSREIFSNKEYAFYQEFGNNQKGAYITPKNKKALSFVIAGKQIFAKKVKTHGPIPFMSEGAKKAESKIHSIFNEILHKRLRDLKVQLK